MRLRSVAVDFPADSDSRLEAPGAAGKVRLVLSTLQRVASVRRVWLITCRVADRLMHSGNCATCDFGPHQCQARQDNVLLEAFPRDVLCFVLGITGPSRRSCPPVRRGRRESAVPHFMVKRCLRRSALQPRLADSLCKHFSVTSVGSPSVWDGHAARTLSPQECRRLV